MTHLLVITDLEEAQTIADHHLVDDNGAPADGTAWVIPVSDIGTTIALEIEVKALAGYIVKGTVIQEYSGTAAERAGLSKHFEQGGWCGFSSRDEAYGFPVLERASLSPAGERGPRVKGIRQVKEARVVATVMYPCGCYISKDEFNNQLLRVEHCPEHHHMYSEDKTTREMATELREKLDT